MRKQAVVYADVAGHLGTLAEDLMARGVSPDGVPEGQHLIFAGDMVHKGPHSEQLLLSLDILARQTPERITILMGNHEAVYHPSSRHRFKTYEALSPVAQGILKRWIDEGVMRVAVGLRNAQGDLLVTHAGVTAPFWRQILQAPASVQETVQALNALPQDLSSPLWRTGDLITGVPDHLAGPLWASSSLELYPSWLAEEAQGRYLRFGQVHGHTSPVIWEKKALRIPQGPLAPRTHVNFKHRHSTVIIGGQLFMGLDPGHGQRPSPQWAPGVFPEARIFVL